MHGNMYNLIMTPSISFRSLCFVYILENTSISFEEASKVHYLVHILHSCYIIES